MAIIALIWADLPPLSMASSNLCLEKEREKEKRPEEREGVTSPPGSASARDATLLPRATSPTPPPPPFIALHCALAHIAAIPCPAHETINMALAAPVGREAKESGSSRGSSGGRSCE
ncbi:hypothetical protein PR202_gb29800 [Eleusine coracana subsp. coracana]|uniref:Uncharacterized protein n=1 Tax=Eleusine coracana subsp. coracana TaxID=191504 RepID=A0AAV5FY12_ELECO|nr:hypothetical protein PR202_gb29800 [Eleusine coracana subsp. coracana]